MVRQGQHLGLAAVVALGVGLAGGAQAADLVVTRGDDEPINIFTTCTGGESCSLREALFIANANGEADTITFAAGIDMVTLIARIGEERLTIREDSGNPVTIDGGGVAAVTIRQTARDRVLQIDDGATVTLDGLVITGGDVVISSGAGGGIRSAGTLTVANSTIEGNEVGENGLGGGILNLRTLTLSNSTISDNRSRFLGGGIANGVGGTLTVINSTISDNQALIGGGGISGGTTRLAFTTISGNQALTGGGIGLGGNVTLKASIVADNPGGDCGGPITSAGFNLDGDGSCGLAAPGDTSMGMAGLGPLQDNGGSTSTQALAATSDALDAIPVADCTDLDGTPVLTDQRGVTRPQPALGNCDIGAFELMDESTGIDDVIDLFDGLVAAGELVGAGPGASGPRRLEALRNMLLTAGDLIAQGQTEEACGQLLQVLRRIDGEPRPGDFAGGAGVDDLINALTALRSDLGCVDGNG